MKKMSWLKLITPLLAAVVWPSATKSVADQGSAGPRPSGGYRSRGNVYTAIDIGAQHGHAGGTDCAVPRTKSLEYLLT